MVMNRGKVEQFDTPEKLITQPATEYVRQLLDTVHQNEVLWEHFK